MKNQDLLQSIDHYCTQHNLLVPNSTIIVGFSGGPDSVFLLHYLAAKKNQYNLSIIAAHLDHQWRENSAEDVTFCQKICDELEIKFLSNTLNNLNIQLKFNGSQEEIGRKARRFFLQQLASTHNAQSIALAHHFNDQQETFFIRLLRGASLAGLVGMKPKQENFIRPLLQSTKEDILTYLDEHKIAYLTDPSNQSPVYLRNRIRHTVLPALQAADSRFDKNCASTFARLQETEEFLQELARNTFEQISFLDDKTFKLDISKLLSLHRVLGYRVIVLWLCQEQVPFTPTQPFFDEMIRFLQNTQSKKHTLTNTWFLIKSKNLIWIEK